jgi:hypothetical protein
LSVQRHEQVFVDNYCLNTDNSKWNSVHVHWIVEF